MIMAVERAGIAATAHAHRVHPGGLVLHAGPVAVATEIAYRGPLRHRRGWRRVIERLEVSGTIDDAAADDGQVAGDVRNLAFRAGEEIAIRNDQIGELTDR